MSKYVGTFWAPGMDPRDVYQVRRGLEVRPAFARRKNRLDRLVGFLRACRLWARVQKHGSGA